MDIIKGRVWKYGDGVNTDVIFPGKYTYTVSNPAEMPEHALEDLDPRFSKEVRAGDIIVAGRNWGCGSSREQAVTCLKESGLGAIVAASFARIYYRNCINAALPALVSAEAVKQIEPGETIEIDLARGVLRAKGRELPFEPLPASVMEIFDAGGLIPYTKMRLERGQ
jgi:3-isopropylmalate/(R)-2-methylmalate dehydratase small subunit